MPPTNGTAESMGWSGSPAMPNSVGWFPDGRLARPLLDADFTGIEGARSRAPDSRTILRAIRRRWFLAALLGLGLMAAAAAGVWRFLPRSYVTSCVVKVSASAPAVLGGQRGDRTEFAVYQKRQLVQ